MSFSLPKAHDIEEGESSRPEPFVPRFQQPPNTSTQTAKSAKSQRTSGWKTSKFFSKTMSSGEILRSLKKLSLTSSGSDSTEVEQQQGRPRKSKSGQLKKRSSCGNDEQPNDDDKARSPRSPGGFRPLRLVHLLFFTSVCHTLGQKLGMHIFFQYVTF